MSDDVVSLTVDLEISSQTRVIITPQPSDFYTVAKPGSVSDPSWHPDGTSLIWVEFDGVSEYSIATMNIGATPNYTILLTAATPFGDPSFSTDGEYILFSSEAAPADMSNPYGIWDLFYMKSTGLDVRTILQDGNANLHPVWVTPTQIAFQWWANGATPSDVFWISLISLGGDGRQDIGEGEYPRTVVQ